MQRLLHGRWLYVGIAAFVVLLYGRTLATKPLELQEHPLPARWHLPTVPAGQESGRETAEALAWWPRSLDREAFFSLLERQPALAVMLVTLSVLMLGMGLWGIVLTGWVVWTKELHALWRLPPRRLTAWSVGELVRIGLLIVMMASLLPFVRLAALVWLPSWELVDHRAWIVSSMLVLDTVLVLTILTFAVDKRPSMWRLKGQRVRRLLHVLEVGSRSYLIVFPWLFLLLAVVASIARSLGFEPPLEAIHELIFQERRPAVLALTVALACVVGPLAEELLFRGVLYSVIRQRTSPVIAMLASAAVFSLFHANVVGFLPIVALGCLLAHVYEQTGSLLSPLVVHIVHNTLLMGLALVFRQLMAL